MRPAVLAQTGAPADTVQAAQAYEPMVGAGAATVSILKMIMALAVVIVCIYAGIWLLKKVMVKNRTGNRSAYLLEVLETAYIDPKKSLSLVRVADRSVLIGVTDNQISMLTELDTELTRAAMEAATKGNQSDNFANMLKSATQKFTGFGKKS